jgi:hypothetical protein
MATDIVTACELLRASGVKSCAFLGLWFPLGRERRIQSVARRRHAVLEAKNLILDALARVQKPLAVLGLQTVKHAREALKSPEHRHLIVTLALNRATLEEEAERYGIGIGASFTQALAELTRARRLLRLTGVIDAPGGELYLLVHLGARARYDLSGLNHLLKKDEEYGTLLRRREQADRERNAGREYRLHL